jgi:diguanylate cyclase (GGDEF)-like protein
LIIISLSQRLDQSRKIQALITMKAQTDALTQLVNRRGFDQCLQIEWQKMLSTATPLSLLMLDVDNFKHYNDQKGHLAGDACLIDIAKIMKSVIQRHSDTIARYGGDEFAILLPNTSLESAIRLANILSKKVALKYIKTSQVSLSIGIASCQSEQLYNQNHACIKQPATQLVSVADHALYQVKKQGKNAVLGQYLTP